MTRYMAFDQSSSCTGYAVGDQELGFRIPTLIQHGVIKPNKKCSDVWDRVIETYFDADSLIREYRPDYVVMEKIHWHGLKTPPTVAAVAAATTACMFAARLNGVVVKFIPPPTVKKLMDAKDKHGVKRRVCQFFDINPDTIQELDESDAIGILTAYVLEKTGGTV